MDSENPGICPTCTHWGKITNPLILGRELAVEVEEKEIEVKLSSDSPVTEKEVIKVMRPTPPRGYSYGANGGTFMERTVEDDDGAKSKKQVMLLPYEQPLHHLEHSLEVLPNRRIQIFPSLLVLGWLPFLFRINV